MLEKNSISLLSSTPGVLVNLHHPRDGQDRFFYHYDNDLEDDHDESGSSACGPINVEAMQQVMAARWAVDVINNQSLPHELKIGKEAICLN